MSYPTPSPSILAIIVALLSNIQSCNSTTKIETIEQSIIELEDKLKYKQTPYQHHTPYQEERESLQTKDLSLLK
ncbi:MAG: hypothetical protein ACI86M_003979 [Saprospiraceae bacterium]